MQHLVVAEWGAKEYRDLVRCIISRTQNEGSELSRLEVRLGRLYCNQPVLLVNRARHALEISLRTFKDREPLRTEVIFPGYVCPSVISSIEKCGLTPVAADIRPDLNIDPEDVARRLSPRTLAVVAVHMYGCPAAIEELERLCKRHRIFLVDDAAQVVGVTFNGRPLGTFGDTGLTSFSQSKTIVAGNQNAGGVLIINNLELEHDIRRRWFALPQGVYVLEDLVAFLRDSQFAYYTRAPKYYVQKVRCWFAQPVRSELPCPLRRMANANAIVALHQLDSLDARVAGRTRVMGVFERGMREYGVASFPQYSAGRYLTRVLAEVPPSIDIIELRRELKRRGIETRSGYGLVDRYTDGLQRVRDLAGRLVEVPSHSQMVDNEIEEVCRVLADSIVSVKAALPARKPTS